MSNSFLLDASSGMPPTGSGRAAPGAQKLDGGHARLRGAANLLASATLVNHVVDSDNEIVNAILVDAPIGLKDPYLIKR